MITPISSHVGKKPVLATLGYPIEFGLDDEGNATIVNFKPWSIPIAIIHGILSLVPLGFVIGLTLNAGT